MQNINTRLKNIRKLLNKSQEEIAQECSVTKQAISNMENAKSLPSLAFLNKLSLNYDVNLNYLICAKGEYFNTNEKSFAKLRESLLKEVENFFDSKGIK